MKTITKIVVTFQNRTGELTPEMEQELDYLVRTVEIKAEEVATKHGLQVSVSEE